jgi:hypothetical protein
MHIRFVCVLDLLVLRWWDLFNHNSRYISVASVCISVSKSSTVCNPQTHAYSSFWKSITVTFKMTVTVRVIPWFCVVQRDINSHWVSALNAIECKIPSLALVIKYNTEVSWEENPQWCVIMVFVESTVLKNKTILYTIACIVSVLKCITSYI